ncbi:hypothetical protein BKA64DRAFT_710834 [Cadophora sp. MPI-SDFR-AT-0126]|nr:hypothetical protein BKA64DRAFT_710834 [Leotiomycetes sp. MPI-SDFR-AT-0126]
MEHIYSLRPSALINVYLLLSLIFDIARSRTIWLHGSNQSLAAVLTCTVAVQFAVLINEAVEKRTILLDRYKLVSPEQTSGIYSKSLFWWLNSLMRTGFQRVLTDQDLYQVDLDMASSVMQQKAQRKWKSASRNHQRALLWSTLKASKAAFAYCIFLRLLLIAFRYTQPFLLSRTVGFANSPTEPESIGWGLTAAIFLVFLGLAVANVNYYHMVCRFVTSVRGILITQIYARTVDLSITALNDSAAVTLMSSDTETICRGFANVHELWVVPVELGLALWLLYRQLGLALLAPAVASFISTASILAIAKYIGNAQKVWIQGIQTRVGVTASTLGSMKAIKILGLTNKVSDIT